MKVMIDSSAVLALLNKRDNYHKSAVNTFNWLVSRQGALIMTNFLQAECYSLLLAKLGRKLAAKWLLTFEWNLFRVSPEDEEDAKNIIFKYKDKDFSFVDATTFTVMTKNNIEMAFTYDKHFDQYGFKTCG